MRKYALIVLICLFTGPIFAQPTIATREFIVYSSDGSSSKTMTYDDFTSYALAYGWSDHAEAGYTTTTSIDTEAELETLLTDVDDVFTTNDGQLDDDDLSDDSINALQDTTVGSTTHTQILMYDGGTAKWINVGTSPTTGQVLEWNGTTIAWAADDASGSSITGTMTTNYIPKATAATTLGNSSLVDDGVTVTTALPLVAATINTGQGATEVYLMDQAVDTTSTPVFATISTGVIATEVYGMDQHVRTTDSPVFAQINTGQGLTEVYAMNQDLETTDAPTFATINTGPGAVECYAMDQPVRTTDAVTFVSVDTGEGANELFDMDQNVQTTDAVTFATVNTGQGNNELYQMDQAVRQADSPTFAGLDLTDGNMTNVGDIALDSLSSDGSDITIAPTSDLHLTPGNTEQVIINSTDAGAVGVVLELYQNSASPAVGDTVGKIKFMGEDNTSVKDEYASIAGKILDPTNGTVDGQLAFSVVTGTDSDTVAMNITGDDSTAYVNIPHYITFDDAGANSPSLKCAIYGYDVAGVDQVHVMGSDGDVTVISSHEEPPGGFDPADPLPWSFTHENILIGKKAVVDMARLVAWVEDQMGTTLTHITDLSPTDMPTTQTWRQTKIREYRRRYIQDRLERNPFIAVNANDAWTTGYETYRERQLVQVTRWEIDPETMTRQQVTRWVPRLVDVVTTNVVNTLKPHVRLHPQTGNFYRKRRASDVTVPPYNPQLPQRIEDRLP
jgi:protein tyrosine phosphatase (PTP) superfamily phosphohydrolase (DUF442 family)